MSIEETLRRSAELTARSQELLAEPRPVTTYEPPQPIRYRGHDIETLDERFKELEAGSANRFAAIDAEFESRNVRLREALDQFTDMVGEETGLMEKRLRQDTTPRKDYESLQAEVAALRVQMSMLLEAFAATGSKGLNKSRASYLNGNDIDAFTN